MDQKRKRTEKECLRCNHKWESYLNKPRTCPKCKSYYWDEKLKVK